MELIGNTRQWSSEKLTQTFQQGLRLAAALMPNGWTPKGRQGGQSRLSIDATIRLEKVQQTLQERWTSALTVHVASDQTPRWQKKATSAVSIPLHPKERKHILRQLTRQNRFLKKGKHPDTILLEEIRGLDDIFPSSPLEPDFLGPPPAIEPDCSVGLSEPYEQLILPGLAEVKPAAINMDGEDSLEALPCARTAESEPVIEQLAFEGFLLDTAKLACAELGEVPEQLSAEYSSDSEQDSLPEDQSPSLSFTDPAAPFTLLETNQSALRQPISTSDQEIAHQPLLDFVRRHKPLQTPNQDKASTWKKHFLPWAMTFKRLYQQLTGESLIAPEAISLPSEALSALPDAAEHTSELREAEITPPIKAQSLSEPVSANPPADENPLLDCPLPTGTTNQSGDFDWLLLADGYEAEISASKRSPEEEASLQAELQRVCEWVEALEGSLKLKKKPTPPKPEQTSPNDQRFSFPTRQNNDIKDKTNDSIAANGLDYIRQNNHRVNRSLTDLVSRYFEQSQQDAANEAYY